MNAFYSKNLPKSTTIYEKLLLAKLESLYFKRDVDALRKLIDKISSKDFMNPLKEFNDIEFKMKKIQSDIQNFCSTLKNETSLEAFYQIMNELIFSQDQTLRILCRIILYWQMILLKTRFDIEIHVKLLKDKLKPRNKLIIGFLHFIQSSLYFINNQDIKGFNEEFAHNPLYFIENNDKSYDVFHYTSLPLPKTFYEKLFNNQHPMTEDDLKENSSFNMKILVKMVRFFF